MGTAASVAGILQELAQEKPIVVFLDDVHFADASSWETMRYLGDHLPAARLLVVAAARTDELAEHDIANRVLLDLDQEGLLHRLKLDPLGRGPLGDLAQAVIGRSPPVGLVDWLFQRSRGNPLFAIGLLQALLEERSDLSAPQLQSLPEGLAGQVKSRLKMLDDSALATVETLAMLGRRVEGNELIVLVDRSWDELAGLLERLVRSRLVIEEEHGQELSYEIAHPLVQEAVYRSIGAARRRLLHREIGQKLFGAARLGEAALHFVRCAQVGDAEAIQALRDAMRQSEEREAYREALAILSALAEMIPHGDPRWLDVLDVMSRQAEWVVDHRAGVHASLGIKAMREIDAVLQGSPDAALQATVQFRLATFLGWGTGNLEEAERACSTALRLFSEASDQSGALLAAVELAFIHALRGDFPACVAESRPAREKARAVGDRFVEMWASYVEGIMSFFQGDFSEGRRLLQHSIDMAVEDHQLHHRTLGQVFLSVALALEGRIGQGLELIAQAKVEKTYHATPLLEWEAALYWLAGDYPAALANGQEALAWNPGGMSKRRGQVLGFAALAAIEMEQPEEVQTYLVKAHATYGDRQWACFNDFCVWAEAMWRWRTDRQKQAIATLRHVTARMLAMNVRPWVAFVLLDLAEVAAHDGQIHTAKKAADQLVEIARYIDSSLYHGLANVARAWVALASDGPDVAAESGRRAVELFSDTGYRAFLARALDVLARALSASGKRQEAERTFGKAAFLFDGCGAVWRREQTLDA